MVEQQKTAAAKSGPPNDGSPDQYYTDPNGVVKPRCSLYENQYTDEQLRTMKQKFLMENVINCGYDPTEFAQFMEYKMGKYLVKTTKTLL